MTAPVPHALVTLEDVSVTHPDADEPTPRNVSFRILPGEVVLLLGPSGCGKSTLAMTLNGLIPHAHDAELTGRVRVVGFDTAETTPAELSRHVGMVFQDPDAQIVTGSVLDEVAFALENLLLPADEVLVRAERALRTVGLWHRRGDDPSVLSGGGRQRLAVACAIAPEPRLLVLDEPTANLDPAGRTDVYAAVRELVRGGVVTQRPGSDSAAEQSAPGAAGSAHSSAARPAPPAVRLVEHDVNAVRELATRMIVLDHDGAVAIDGAPDEVLIEHAQLLRELGVGPDEGGETTAEPTPPNEVEGAPPPTTIPERTLPPAASTPSGVSPDHGDETRPARRTHINQMGDQSGASRQTPGGSAVVARALTVTRGRGRGAATLLRDVTLEVPRGSFTAIIGPNGAGKTTLAQAIAGVVPPPRGQVLIARDGAPPLDAGSAKPRELAAQIGFVFQNPEHQFVAHTVRDELAHGLRRFSPADRDARVDEMLDRFDLRAHADRHPFRLSGGQKRRRSVGTALIGGADRPGGVLVLDEPTFGQDRARADALLALIDELHRGGTTVIVVTHDPDLVARHATHIAAVRDGRLASFGPADEVLPLVREPAFWRPDAGTNTQVPFGHPGPAHTDHDPPDVHPRPAPSRSPLERFDSLALLAAVLPAMIGLVFTRDVATPAIAVAVAYAVVLIGAPKTRALAVWLCVILPVMALAIAGGFTLWSDAATGAATGLRLTALLALALIPGLSTDGTAFVRSVVAHLRVPYRIGYAALAAYRFVPRFRHELEVIRSAHRVRGTGGDPVSRAFTAIVPLLASAIRHAERVALAMDARAFGAFPTRTERHPPRWRVRDTVAVVVGLVVTAAVFASGAVLPD